MSDATPEVPSRSDMALLRRAVNARWPIPEAERPAIVSQMIATVVGADDDRSRIAAAKVIAAMDKLNMEQEKRDDPNVTDRLKVVIEYVDSHDPAAPPAPLAIAHPVADGPV
jgi:hypothetical protein